MTGILGSLRKSRVIEQSRSSLKSFFRLFSNNNQKKNPKLPNDNTKSSTATISNSSATTHHQEYIVTTNQVEVFTEVAMEQELRVVRGRSHPPTPTLKRGRSGQHH